MSIESALRDKVIADAPLLGGRFYPVKLKQNTEYPAGRYQRISGVRGYNQQGADGLVTSRFQIDVFDETYDGARAAWNQIKVSLNGKKEGEILMATIDNDEDSYEDETKLFRVSSDFMISYCD